MIRVIAAVAAGVVLALIFGGLLAGWIEGSGQSSQACQFAQWESQKLWPQGGGPPLPPGC